MSSTRKSTNCPSSPCSHQPSKCSWFFQRTLVRFNTGHLTQVMTCLRGCRATSSTLCSRFPSPTDSWGTRVAGPWSPRSSDPELAPSGWTTSAVRAARRASTAARMRPSGSTTVRTERTPASYAVRCVQPRLFQTVSQTGLYPRSAVTCVSAGTGSQCSADVGSRNCRSHPMFHWACEMRSPRTKALHVCSHLPRQPRTFVQSLVLPWKAMCIDHGDRLLHWVQRICQYPDGSDILFSEGAIRLTGSSDPHSGRVEIFHGGTWGKICSKRWSDNEASVVCRSVCFVHGCSTETLLQIVCVG